MCYRNIDPKVTEYFDPFGSDIPTEVMIYLKTSSKDIFYSRDEIQDRDSVLCGYWCLYYLNERDKGRSILETIHNPNFNYTDNSVNNIFIKSYFRCN